MKFKSLAASSHDIIDPKIETILANPKVKLKFGDENMVLSRGVAPFMVSTKAGTLIVQGSMPQKALPQKRIFFPYAIATVVSRDQGKSWQEFKLKPGDNGFNFEGGAKQLKDGTIIALETYVIPGEKPDTGAGLLYYSNDDYRTLQGPVVITFNIPNANFNGSTDDGGRPQAAQRLHRRIVELPDGDLLTTIYGWQMGDNEPSGYVPTMKKTRVMLFRSKNKGRHWDFVSTVAADPAVGTEGFGEPVIERISKGPKAGRLICLMRTGHELYKATSDDEGKTWSKAQPHIIGGIDVYQTDKWKDTFKDVTYKGKIVADSPAELIGNIPDPDLLELRSGVLVAAFGARIPAKAYSLKQTHPLNGNYLAFSLDHGDTWSHVVRLTSGEPTMQYMAIEELPGKNQLYVTYVRGSWRDNETRYICGRKVEVLV